jgi:hypothetical protein
MVFRKVGSAEVTSKRVITHKRPNIDGKPHLTEDAARAEAILGLTDPAETTRSMRVANTSTVTAVTPTPDIGLLPSFLLRHARSWLVIGNLSTPLHSEAVLMGLGVPEVAESTLGTPGTKANSPDAAILNL